jgi:thiamine pyrophosphate-dependent acetolactate synthase large subunit-like protein
MALGAQAGRPGEPVLCIAGDGGFQMHTGELATAVQEKLPVVLVLFNNRGYGVLKRIQEKMMGGRIFGVDLHTPDFAKVAQGHGMHGERADTPGELENAVKRAFASGAPTLIDCHSPFEP